MDFTNKEGIFLVTSIIKEICSNRDYLSKIDAAVGDGDHGINMSKGFTLALEEIVESNMNMSDGFITISKVLVRKIGGSMGPLYGSFFRGLSASSREYKLVNSSVILEMLLKAYANISDITTATVGDKTLIDVLDPAVKAYELEFNNGRNLEYCLNQMLIEAEKGLESTKNMVAKLGRGSRLGERSIGHQDAGATSCYIILKAFAEASINLAKK